MPRKKGRRKGLDHHLPPSAVEASNKRQELRDKVQAKRDRERTKDWGLYVREVSGGAFGQGKKR